MELKDSALPMLASALVLLLLALFTGGLPFYAAFAALFIFIIWDFTNLLLATRSLDRELSLSSSLSRAELPPGASTSFTLHAAYHGRRSGIVLSLEPLLDDALDARPPVREVRLRKGEESTLSMSLIPRKPGDYRVGMVKLSVSSLLFAATRVRGEAKSIRVRLSLGEHLLRPNAALPGYRKTDAPVSMVDRRRGSDFFGVRLYTPGDSVRNIDWALTSRAGHLVVREFEADRALPAYFLVDVSARAFEESVAVASGLIDRELLEGEKIGLICFSRSEIVQHVRPGMGRQHMRRLSEVLSKLHAVDDSMSAGPFVSVSEIYGAGQVIGKEAGSDVLSPVIEETFKGYLANVREDGFIKAILAAAGDSKSPCEIRVITGLSMGLPSLMNGLRLARYYGHSALVILSGNEDGERAMELEYARKKLMASSIKVVSARGREMPEGRIGRGRSHIRG
ncbi:MAG TPA: DUF58 domain-containing protein [Methanocella sp.]|uniref:DUF58 domain-containing protein n=1 Tax=Methanocella sp. TaxID=2052833 RepID=UPI002BB37558|nr:DUF58 domain-containing protein [Methanocella sp.]HTY90206.1 DUF58 domain-containing protein [Methanocella sp.]